MVTNRHITGIRGTSGIRGLLGAGTVVALVLGLCTALTVDPADAAPPVTLTVTTTADTDASHACTTPSVQTAQATMSLREAVCIADNITAVSPSTIVTVQLGSATYTLTAAMDTDQPWTAGGPDGLQIGTGAGAQILLAGQGDGHTTIHGDGVNRVIDADPELFGGVGLAISGLKITGGVDSSGLGGAGIIAGNGGLSAAGDTLDLEGVTVSNNTVAAGTTDTPGGGVQFAGGRLTIVNSTISGNSAGSSYGGGVSYRAYADSPSDALTLSGDTFSGNTLKNDGGGTSAASGGAALEVDVESGSPMMTVSDSLFENNTISGGDQDARGGAIWVEGGALTVTNSNFAQNSVGSAAGTSTGAVGGAVYVGSGATASVSQSRFFDNAGANASQVAADPAGSLTADQDWWGCNSGPVVAPSTSATCGSVAHTIIASHLRLDAVGAPSFVSPGSASVSVGLTASDGSSLADLDRAGFADSSVAWSADALGSVSGIPTHFGPGNTTSTTYSSTSTTGGNGLATATYDNEAVPVPVTVERPAAITSTAAASFALGTAGTFSVTTSGFPAPSLSESGALPSGVTFTDGGSGTATLAGTPAAGTAGSYPITITAHNGIGSDATQNFTLSVGQAPTITSASSATFTAGALGTFDITTDGLPRPSISETGALPSGVTLHDNGDGSATLSGTPTPGSAGSYPITITASNGFGTAAAQSFTLDVDAPPSITGSLTPTFTVGTSASFLVHTTGLPTPSISTTAALPAWLSLVDNGDGTATLGGTPPVGSGGTIEIPLTAANGVGSDAHAPLTLTIDEAPAISSSTATTFTVGTSGTFTVTTTGFPKPTLSKSGALPSGVTFVDNHDGTATVSGTPAAGTGGAYPITITASNGIGTNATQAFALTADERETITSGLSPTFTVGTHSSVTIHTAGYPTATPTGAISASGEPAWLTFVDNGDGTATMSGTPTAGSGGTPTFTVTATNGVGAPDVQTVHLTVDEAVAISSAASATFVAGAAPTPFTVQTTGFPVPVLTESGTLPSGMTFTDNHDGTATLTGTPAATAAGDHTIVLTAHNGIGADATQNFQITVNRAASITSANSASFGTGSAGTFTVTTAGFPLPTLSASGALPSGVTFVDNHDGSATIGGTPAAGTGGSYPLTITAHNGVGSDATQTFTLTVGQPTAFTSANAKTFVVGTSGTFTVTTSGFPVATSVTETGTLPNGIAFTDNGDGTATIGGTAAVGAGGTYPLVLTAKRGGIAQATQNVTLTVGEAPHITTQPSDQIVAPGTSVTYIAQAAGFPAPTVDWQVEAAGTSTWTSLGVHTTTLTFTATAADTGKHYRAVFTNGIGTDATSDAALLTVGVHPAFTSSATATWIAGVSNSVTVTTTGVPNAAITSSDLPGFLTLTDHGNGTATVSGSAPLGGGFTFHLHAANGIAPAADQTFTLIVDAPPTITSRTTVTMTVGVAGSFDVTTTGVPSAALTESGALPHGIAFTDRGNGTGALTGVPAAGSGGTYPITFTATNAAGSVVQHVTLTVLDPVTISSAQSTTFTVGTHGSFTIAADSPTTPSFALPATGTLPSGVTFHDNGNGTASLAGTPASGSGGVYPLTITATSGSGTAATQQFTLVVDEATTIVSSSVAHFRRGHHSTFTVRTGHSYPSVVTLKLHGSLPKGLKFTVLANGTARITGTPTGRPTLGHTVTITATNTIAPAAKQRLTIVVAGPAAVHLPRHLPASAGRLHGVPAQLRAGHVLHIRASGFAPYSPIVVGLYPGRIALAAYTANAHGALSRRFEVPTDLRGQHTVLVVGRRRNGTVRYLKATIDFSG